MGINKIQFQKGLSMAEFMERYGTEEKCQAALAGSRWPSGFVCPECGGARHSTFDRKGLQYWQCSTCREPTMRSIFPSMPIATSLKSNIDLIAASTCRSFCPDCFEHQPLLRRIRSVSFVWLNIVADQEPLWHRLQSLAARQTAPPPTSPQSEVASI